MIFTSRTNQESGIKNQEYKDAKSKETPLQDPHGQAAYARRAACGDHRPLPSVPRAEGSAPRVPALRLLSRAPGAARRRGVGICGLVIGDWFVIFDLRFVIYGLRFAIQG